MQFVRMSSCRVGSLAVRSSFSGCSRSALFTSRSAFSTYRYLPSHEWVKPAGDGTATVGISDFAQAQLGEVVFVDLPEAGEEFEANDTFGSVESVKAASDVYLPVGGKVLEVNEKLSDTPELVNSHAMSDAWFVKIGDIKEDDLESLMGEAEYAKFCEDGDIKEDDLESLMGEAE
eukprot:CAMPEP_0203746066 /NCGR_PEP_ID=MMETSP0098-20131031/1615_1 /ASSEMBLY_ACC=CAM_ASM_000208 /TAXON_ID=96639 /ORGANISM=" , Strain NY0313808BC1" /LENGTH=174 /DNA_ID=CAMNT_0050634031 /DNA_START=44 /DNA_END=566 /DNA_ORIENTATION=-